MKIKVFFAANTLGTDDSVDQKDLRVRDEYKRVMEVPLTPEQERLQKIWHRTFGKKF
jgi:hypothetical protein